MQNLDGYSHYTQYYGPFCNVLYRHSNGQDYCHINQALADKIRSDLPVDMKTAGKILNELKARRIVYLSWREEDGRMVICFRKSFYICLKNFKNKNIKGKRGRDIWKSLAQKEMETLGEVRK